MVAYHDDEWGQPTNDDNELFEMLCLEGAQAGLSWQTILRKRAGYRRAFAGFDPKIVARYTEVDEARLLADAGIVRNRAKIKAAIGNAQAALRLSDEFGSLHAYFAGRVPQPPHTLPRDATPGSIPVTTPVSDALAKDLQKRGWKFVGSTIVYSFMQSVGLVDDHLPMCFRYRG